MNYDIRMGFTYSEISEYAHVGVSSAEIADSVIGREKVADGSGGVVEDHPLEISVRLSEHTLGDGNGELRLVDGSEQGDHLTSLPQSGMMKMREAQGGRTLPSCVILLV